MKYNMEPMLKERNKVYLLWWNIEIKRLSNKFDYKKLGLFKIDKVIKTINY